ncbi:MAG TPA: glycosyltransferase family 9 protein [Chloroflexota bacterium]|nr:glycosyltransferase family 9 protein [Chloroflexota bacterium]
MNLTSPPVTRLPYPPAAEARHVLVGCAYRFFGGLFAPAFRRPITLGELTHAKILIFKPCCLGDVLFATPLVRELRRALPSARLVFGVGKHSRAAVATNPHLDDRFDTGPVGSGAYTTAEYLDLLRRIRAERFDACFVLERSALLALLPRLAGVPRVIGIDSGGRGFALNVGVSARPSRPESELYLDLLRAIGGQPEDGALEYQPTPAAEERVRALLPDGLSRPLVVVHAAGGVNPGMVLTRKRWPGEHFRAIAERARRAGGTVVLVGGPEDRDTGSALGEVEGVVDLIGRLSLDELAALARRADVYLGNDSGPSHLAEAAGARVVMLFGPSDPLVYGPRGRNAVAVTAGLACSPCFEDGRVAPCANVLCMPSLSVERVWREVAEACGLGGEAP